MALTPITLFNIKGRWGVNAPFSCPLDQCIEAENVEWWRSSFARKRQGSARISLAGGTGFTGGIKWVYSWVPSDNQTIRELWGLDSAITPLFKRLVGGTAWANVTNSSGDAVTLVDNHLTNGCQFNGKLFIAYNSTVNRLHMYDPAVAAIQRVGIANPVAAPSVADTGAGAYAATPRFYKIAFVEVLTGTIINARSNTSASVGFTPSGAGTAARITRPALPGEKETHWIVYGSSADADFVQISGLIAVGTLTYDDTVAPASYIGTIAPDPAAFNPPPSVKYLVADKAQLVMGGAWEATTGTGIAPTPRRVWWTSPLGATDQGDDQRISLTATIKSYTDLDEAITAMSSPQEGTIFIWSYRSMWRMVATGVAVAPYMIYKVTGAKGCIEHKSVVAAEDENGDSCTYWWSPQGPCRVSNSGGMASLMEDINDIWDLINLGATMVCHGLFHSDKHQVWWWVTTIGSTSPNMRVIFDTRLGRAVEPGIIRKGWATHTLGVVDAWASAMHSDTLGVSNSYNLKPYASRNISQSIIKCDTGAQDDDVGTMINFRSYITTRPYTPAGLGNKSGINEDACLVAEQSTNPAPISMAIIRDFGFDEVAAGDVSLTHGGGGTGTPTRIFPRFDNSNIALADSVQFRIGDTMPLLADASPIATWNLDAMSIPNTPMGNM